MDNRIVFAIFLVIILAALTIFVRYLYLYELNKGHIFTDVYCDFDDKNDVYIITARCKICGKRVKHSMSEEDFLRTIGKIK